MKEKTAAIDADTPETAQIIAEIDDIFKRIELLNERTQQNQSEIDRLKQETWPILNELKLLCCEGPCG